MIAKLFVEQSKMRPCLLPKIGREDQGSQRGREEEQEEEEVEEEDGQEEEEEEVP